MTLSHNLSYAAGPNTLIHCFASFAYRDLWYTHTDRSASRDGLPQQDLNRACSLQCKLHLALNVACFNP
jgi:hypothetical protein